VERLELRLPPEDFAAAAAPVAVDLITGGRIRRVRSIRSPVLFLSSVERPSLPG